MTLTELEAKLAAATAPSRELDVAIAEAIGYWRGPLDDSMRQLIINEKEAACDECGQGDKYVFPNECYTSSIDAAVALCEAKLPGGYWEVRCNPFAGVRITGGSRPLIWVQKAASPALALCLAVVRALIEKEKH